MAATSGTVRRILFLKVTLPSADPAYVRSVVQATAPFYALLGGTSMRLLRNVDDPAQFIQEITYDTPEAMEISRQRIAGDLRIQSFLQAWRQVLGGAAQVEVWEDLTSEV